jgi:hypothetical protein
VRDISGWLHWQVPRCWQSTRSTLLAQGADRADPLVRGEGGTDNSDVEHVAHGLMSIRQNMRRTTAVVACLPTAWEAIRSRATATVSDRFREARSCRAYRVRTSAGPSWNAGSPPATGRSNSRRRIPAGPFSGRFEDAPNYTPRLLLQRADTYVRSCLDQRRRGVGTPRRPLAEKRTRRSDEIPVTLPISTAGSPTIGGVRWVRPPSLPRVRTPRCPACCPQLSTPGSPNVATPSRRSGSIRRHRYGRPTCTVGSGAVWTPQATTSDTGVFVRSPHRMPSQRKAASRMPAPQRVSAPT